MCRHDELVPEDAGAAKVAPLKNALAPADDAMTCSDCPTWSSERSWCPVLARLELGRGRMCRYGRQAREWLLQRKDQARGRRGGRS